MATTIQSTTSNNLGQLTINQDNWFATLEESASAAISFVDWNGTNLQVTFRRKSGIAVVYEYNVRNNANNVLLDEIQSVLDGVEDASIGAMFNRLIKSNDIISID
jgi:hypothetical protein